MGKGETRGRLTGGTCKEFGLIIVVLGKGSYKMLVGVIV